MTTAEAHTIANNSINRQIAADVARVIAGQVDADKV